MPIVIVTAVPPAGLEVDRLLARVGERRCRRRSLSGRRRVVQWIDVISGKVFAGGDVL